MKTSWELVGMLTATGFALALPGVAVWGQNNPGSGWKCDGNYNCVTQPCVNPPNYSCAMVTPIDHPKCVVGNRNECCHSVQTPCARLDYYAGVNCNGNPLSCQGGISLGLSGTVSEPGCDPANPCPSPPGEP